MVSEVPLPLGSVSREHEKLIEQNWRTLRGDLLEFLCAVTRVIRNIFIGVESISNKSHREEWKTFCIQPIFLQSVSISYTVMARAGTQ
jgi:hypothetical protein